MLHTLQRVQVSLALAWPTSECLKKSEGKLFEGDRGFSILHISELFQSMAKVFNGEALGAGIHDFQHALSILALSTQPVASNVFPFEPRSLRQT
eukprot:Skav202292  [mRNA]  locus=scaffold3364:76264:77341:- [translate_table: standard]